MPGRGYFASLVVQVRRDMHNLLLAIQSSHFAYSVGEMVPMTLRKVTDLVVRHIHATRGYFMQLGFPDVRAVALNQSDFDTTPPPQCVTQACGQLQACSTTADDDDAVSSNRKGLRA